MRHWRPSEKVNSQRSGLRFSEGSSGSASESCRCLSFEITDLRKEEELGPLSRSCAVVICNVSVKVNASQCGYYVDNCGGVKNGVKLTGVRLAAIPARTKTCGRSHRVTEAG